MSIMNRTRKVQLQLAQYVAVVDRLLALDKEEADDMKVTSNDNTVVKNQDSSGGVGECSG